MSYYEVTASPLFNSPQSVSGSFSYVLAALGLMVDLPCVIFLFNEFRYSKSPLRSAYFIILSIGLVITVVAIIVRMWFSMDLYLSEITWKAVISSIYQWYAQNVLGFWMFVLACNRCTALVSPKWHNIVSVFLLQKSFLKQQLANV